MTKYEKHFEKIRGFQTADEKHRPFRPAADFDLTKLNGSLFARLRARITMWALRSFGLQLMQRFFPVFRLGGIHFVTRYDDVVTILARSDVFRVPFGLEMEAMTTEPRFMLGDDGAIHKEQLGLIDPV